MAKTKNKRKTPPPEISTETQQKVDYLCSHGETMMSIAYKLGTSLATVYNWRAGKTPLGVYVEKLDALVNACRGLKK